MSRAEETWRDVGDQFASLGHRFRDHYREVEASSDVSHEEVAESLRSFGDAIDRVFTSLGNALRDPDVREDAKEAAETLLSALGATFQQIGDEVRDTVRREKGDEAGAAADSQQGSGATDPTATGDV